MLDNAVGLVRRPTKGEKFNDKPALQTPCRWILVTNEDQKKVSKKEIKIDDAPPGLYMIRLYTDKGVLVRKLVVE